MTNIAYPSGFSGAWAGTVAAGMATNVTVSFAPVALQSYGGTITLFSDATSGTNTLGCSGTGLTPALIAVSPAGHDFGLVVTGQTVTTIFTVTNLGDFALSGTTLVSGAFAVIGDGSFNLSGHDATNISVSFTSLAEGSFSNDAIFISNGGGSTNPVLGVAVIVPVMPVIADRTVPEMTLMVLTNAQLNADIPTDRLSYALLAPPDGMLIETNSGIISWTPSEAQGPGTNIITTVVTESGMPPLFATNSFSIIVSEGNVAPVIAAASNRTVYPGQLLTITNTASDADLPANALSFSLVAAPANAAIDATSGIFSWTATSADAGTTNPVTVHVTDDGVPPMSAETSFDIIVEMPPVFLADIAAGPVLSWPLGASAFVLEFATNLADVTAWISVTNVPVISGGMLTVTNVPLRDAEFFRLRLP